MLTTFAKTSNVSNKPGLTLENAGDYRDLTVLLLSVLALHIPSWYGWKMLEDVGQGSEFLIGFPFPQRFFIFPPAGSAEILGELWGAEDLG